MAEAVGSLGDLVVELRRQAMLSQEELAERAGLSVRAVRNIERGGVARPQRETLTLLAGAFGLDERQMDRLFELAGRPAGTGIGAHPAWGVPTVRPAQLPADVSTFVGRQEHLARLDGLLTAERPAVLISAVAGMAGVGKTALAVHWAHRVRDRFPDGQLYVNLRGFDPGGPVVTAADALRGFLDALGAPPHRIPTDLPAQAALYRSLLADRHVLVVLDNARDADQVRPLLPGTPGCVVLVTSRKQLTSLIATDGAHLLPLDLLTAAEARDLLVRRLGRNRVAAEPRAVEDVIARCARLPIALAIMAARAATRPDFPLAALVDDLRQAQGGLDAFTGQDATTDLRAVFHLSYRDLNPAAARLFRLLGVHPGPEIGTRAAASLAGLPVHEVRPLLGELTDAHLVTEHVPGRYAFHDLLRAYATELAHAHETDAEPTAVLRRALDHYLHTAHGAALRLDPQRAPITLAPAHPSVTPEHIADHSQALTWFTTERSVLVAAIRRAATTGLHIHTWQLAWTLTGFLGRQGHWHDLADIQRMALTAARRLADPAGRAEPHRGLAIAYAWLGHHDDAHSHLRQALDLFAQIGDHTGQAYTHHTLAWLLDQQERHVEALDHSQQALHHYTAADDRVGRARALSAVGWHHAQLGDHQQALVHCQQSVPLHRAAGDRHGEGETWNHLGYAHHHLGHHHEAITCYRNALDLIRDQGDRHSEATTLNHLGDSHDAVNQSGQARTMWHRALAILRDLDHPDADEVRTKLDRSVFDRDDHLAVERDAAPVVGAELVRQPRGVAEDGPARLRK